MNNKRTIILTISILLFGLIVAGSTFAWYTWRSSDAERTSVTFSVPDGNDELKAILDADNTSYTGLVPASGCGSNNALMATITLHYKNMTISDAEISATLSLDSITNVHSGTIDKSKINWIISTNSRATCDSGIIRNGSGTLDGKSAGDSLYTGNLTTGMIAPNTPLSSKTLYLYFWLDSSYTSSNYGNSIVADPMQDLTIKVVWSGSITNSNLPTLYNAIAGQQIKTTPYYLSSQINSGDEGVYQTTEDGVTVYYYRGAVTDNNVLYDNKCWKIVRTTKTHGIKMIYNGTPTTENDVTTCGGNTSISQISNDSCISSANYRFNDTNFLNVDYSQSTLKGAIDTWFNQNVNRSYLEQTNFCIDLSGSYEDGTITYYAPYTRWAGRYSSTNPTYDCTGSGKYPNTGYVGLLTIDELWYAGGGRNDNTYYLYNSSGWWLLSPYYVDTADKAYMFFGSGSGTGYYAGTNSYYGVRPVISLASDVKYTGNGTYNNPYRISS